MAELTTDPKDPRLGHGEDKEPRPQQEVYLVLSKEERDKGFERPLRDTYRHVGPPGPQYELRDLTEEEKERYPDERYVKFEPYPESMRPKVGHFWTQAELDAVGKGCNTITIMGQALAETYARNHLFYGATYCVSCQRHIKVNEFIWEADGQRVGS